jgi:hypothetical protein
MKMKNISLGYVSDENVLRINIILNEYCKRNKTLITRKDLFLMLLEELEIKYFGKKMGEDFYYSETMKKYDEDHKKKILDNYRHSEGDKWRLNHDPDYMTEEEIAAGHQIHNEGWELWNEAQRNNNER